MNAIKHVSLTKPRREPEDLVSLNIVDAKATSSLPSITPEHICEEYIPGDIATEERCITPVHVTDENILHSITPVHATEEISVSTSHTVTHEIKNIQDKSTSRTKFTILTILGTCLVSALLLLGVYTITTIELPLVVVELISMLLHILHFCGIILLIFSVFTLATSMLYGELNLLRTTIMLIISAAMMASHWIFNASNTFIT